MVAMAETILAYLRAGRTSRYVGKCGWQDWNIVQFALENDYVVATNNRRHFLREYLKRDLHSGLIIIVPNVERDGQIEINNHQLSWWFDGEPLKAVLKDSATFVMGSWDQ